MKTDLESAYGAKLRQCNKEALITIVALAATVVVWAVFGFGLSGIGARILGVPVWVVGGCVGTWVFAIVVSIVLAKSLFKDFDVEEAGAAEGGSADAAPQGGER